MTRVVASGKGGPAFGISLDEALRRLEQSPLESDLEMSIVLESRTARASKSGELRLWTDEEIAALDWDQPIPYRLAEACK